VPDVFGLTLTAATASIRRAHCTVGLVRRVYSNIFYPGIVYSQSPPRGSVLASGARVHVTVSLGITRSVP
jgi:beta-lactam-binding protein with PASTA domain